MIKTKRFGTFEGVFTPTVLSILGVIMYLRLGWVVGQLGLSQAVTAIIIANLITLFTALSISSITTNMRVGTGGAYAMISKSLGLEVGGSIGIPLYLSQALSVAFYIAGFSECWVAIFPGHIFGVVSLVVWMALLIIAYISAKLAFRLQYIIIAIIGLSLLSIFFGGSAQNSPIIFGAGDLGFWRVFAVFFPAVTGILAGVSMSGELKDPQRSIPLGSLSAIGVTLFIYILLAYRFSRSAPAQELIGNTSIILDMGRWKSLVVAGIMGATLSSALSMFVASSRTLLALGKHRIIPFSPYFSSTNSKGEPATSILFTALIALLTISLGTLNKIAGLLTMFFLITYGMLNASVFIEKGIGLISFRPTFKIPLMVSFFGGVGCFYVMFLINSVFSVIALAVVVLIYILLLRTEIKRGWPDVRKGIFIFIAEQAVKIASALPYHPKIWKPNLLVPVQEPGNWPETIEFIKAITSPSGRADIFRVIGRSTLGERSDFLERAKDGLHQLALPLKKEGVLYSASVFEAADFLEGARIALQINKDGYFPANVLFIKLEDSAIQDRFVEGFLKDPKSSDLGAMIFKCSPGLFKSDENRAINIWIRRGSPNIDLAVLVTLQLQSNWDAKLRILQAVSSAEEKEDALRYLQKLKKAMRLPLDTETFVLRKSFVEAIAMSPAADINILGLAEGLDISWARNIAGKFKSSVLFLKDSKHESALV